MEIIKTSIKDLILIQPKLHEDDRGYFMEFYKRDFWKENFKDIEFVQENESKSKYGVLRGMHFQKAPFAQSKLIRVIKGKIQDVVIDLRKESPTYGQKASFILSEVNKLQLFVPRGFAHGFLSLSNEVIINYKVDNYYNKQAEDGIKYNDKYLNIKWELSQGELLVSKKDKKLNFDIINYKASNEIIF